MFFAPPKPLATTVFASYPKEFNTAGHDNDWVNTQPGGGGHRGSALGGSFFRPRRKSVVRRHPQRPHSSGVARLPILGGHPIRRLADRPEDPSGRRVFITDAKHGIMVLDPANGKVAPYLVRAGLEQFKAVNDLFFAANGDCIHRPGLSGWQDRAGACSACAPGRARLASWTKSPRPTALS